MAIIMTNCNVPHWFIRYEMRLLITQIFKVTFCDIFRELITDPISFTGIDMW